MLSAVLMLGLAGTAFAAHLEMTSGDTTLKVGGDVLIDGIYTENAFDADSDVQEANVAHWYQRVRLQFDAVLASGVEVRTRLRLSNGDWGNNETDGDVDGSSVGGNAAGNDITTDWAYIFVPYQGVNFYIGRQPASWGNKLMVWAAEKERLKFTYKMDNIVVGGFYEKSKDLKTVGGDSIDSYSVFATVKFEGGNAGIIGVYNNNDTVSSGGDGFIIDVYGNYRAADLVDLAAEISYKGSDLYETSTNDSGDLGAFISGAAKFDAIGVSLALAYAADGFKADDHFTPTLLFGTDQATAPYDFMAGADASSFAIVLGATYDINEDMGIGANIAYAMMSDWSPTSYVVPGQTTADADLFEIDLFFNYQINADLSWWLGLAYGMPSDFSADDDGILSVAHEFALSF